MIFYKLASKILFLLIVFSAIFVEYSVLLAQEEDEDDYIEESDVDDTKVESVPDGIFEDVKNFDVAGFRIGMNPKVSIKLAKQMKYIVNTIVNDTPEYVRYNFDIICRRQNIFQIDALNACVDGYAKKKKLNYIKEIKLIKPTTGEKINLFFTSPLTQNLIYRIEYKIDLMSLNGDQKKFLYEREENRRAFWYGVIEKYGKPNIQPNKWVYDAKKPTSTVMTANFEGILLENKGIYEIDIIEGIKKARVMFKPIEFSF